MSVILVNFRGAADVVEAVRVLRDDVLWDARLLEVIVVDNASGDGSAERIRGDLGPDARVVESPSNLGFAGGCNLGVRESSGEILAFLNGDARPQRDWIGAAVPRFSDPSVGAVASRVLDVRGERVDYIGSAMTWFGMAYKPYVTQEQPRRRTDPVDVLFGTGSAMFVRRTVFEALGGFDEDYFMFYEDVDLGWRLTLAGHRFVYEPRSIAHHRHHASMVGYGEFKERYLLERNALFTLYKNLGEPALGDVMAGALALSIRRGIALAGSDSTDLDLRRGASEDDEQTVSRQILASVNAVDQFVQALPRLRVQRAEIQRTRVASESAIRELFGESDQPILRSPYFVDGYEHVVEAFDVVTDATRPRALIITGDPLGRRMAGPAIRAWRMAEELTSVADVVLMTTEPLGYDLPSAPFEVISIAPGEHRSLAAVLEKVGVVIFQGNALEWFPEIGADGRIIVADVYDPMHLEQLEQARDQPPGIWAQQVAVATEILNRQLSRADFVICASERQRSFYLGQLAALGRLSAANYADDPYLDRLLAVVPFGLDATPPVHTRRVIKGVVPGIGENDRVLIWAGGIYNWFDPVTLVEAMALLADRMPDVKLFFLGTKHPHPGVPEMRVLLETRNRAEELGLLDVAVFFNDGWVDFADRQNYLLEADLGVSTHRAHLETEYSFRTRILDYLWAGLPMVVTEGDVFAQLVERESLGAVVEAENAARLADAIATLLSDQEALDSARLQVDRVRERFMWPRVLSPVIDFVRTASPARDRAGSPARAIRVTRTSSVGLRRDLGRFVLYVREAGLAAALRRGGAAVRRRMRR